MYDDEPGQTAHSGHWTVLQCRPSPQKLMRLMVATMGVLATTQLLLMVRHSGEWHGPLDLGRAMGPAGTRSQSPADDWAAAARSADKAARAFELLNFDLAELKALVAGLERTVSDMLRNQTNSVKSIKTDLQALKEESIRLRHVTLSTAGLMGANLKTSRRELSRETTRADQEQAHRNGSSARAQSRVLLLSEPRSGSTLVGEFFNRDSRVFYLYEPCRLASSNAHDGSADADAHGEACAALVSRLLSCRISPEDAAGLYRDPYAVQQSRVLSQHRHFSESFGREEPQILQSVLETSCRDRLAVVVKETRLAEVYRDLAGPELGLHLVHVITDPRATLHSLPKVWRRTATEEEMRQRARQLCQQIEKRAVTAGLLGPEQYSVLAYEEILRDPLGSVRRMYDAVGLGAPPESVLSWLAPPAPTPAPSPKLGRAAYRKVGPASTPASETARPAMARMAVEAIKWAAHASPALDRAAWASCSALMEELRYGKLQDVQAEWTRVKARL